MPINTILITGHSGAGKGCVAKILSDEIKKLHSEHQNPVQIISFADPVKEIACKMLNNSYPLPNNELWSVENMYDLEYKEREHPEYQFNGKNLRVRDVLIFIGMEMRSHKDNVWAEIASEKIKKLLEEYELSLIHI